jgi:ferredoxin hydrogenase large subunit/hydrogenase large subunit
MAFGVLPTDNGRLLRNVIAASNFIQSHILHFYTLSALDFIDVTAVLGYQGSDASLNYLKTWVQNEVGNVDLFPAAPFLPRFDGDYITDAEINLGALRHYMDALEMRTEATRMGAFFGGKIPHAATLFPGGVSQPAKIEHIVEAKKIIRRLRHFIETAYLPDVVAAAQAAPQYFSAGVGCGNFLAFGAFHETNDGSQRLFPSGALIGGALQDVNEALITEDVASSYFSSGSGLHPSAGETTPLAHKTDAYSWLKAPRYNGQVMEVGPLARVLVAWHRNHPTFKPLVDATLQSLGRPMSDLVSVMGRHAVRALECKVLADRTEEWIDAITPDAPTMNSFTKPTDASGYGLTEAARGALGHWLQIASGKISRYQCVVPTTWNCSPRDDADQPGALEQALVGTPIADADHPIEAVRIVRSFDPCVSCSVH